MPTYAEDEDTEEAMYRATIRALQTLGLTGDAISNIEAHISSGEVYDSVKTSNRQNTRMTGVNALA
jgi:3-oxoacyl-(acyl-carrier-protein) synthase